MSKKAGSITQIIGPVVDVQFIDGLPNILDALTVEKEGEKIVLEVAQFITTNLSQLYPR